MPNQRVTIASWTDEAGLATAVPLQSYQYDAIAAYAESPSIAVRQVKDALRWMAKRGMWVAETEIDELESRQLRFAMRVRQRFQHEPAPAHSPRRRSKRREGAAVLLAHKVELRLPLVIGRLDQQRIAILPTLGLSFITESSAEFVRMAEEQVRDYLADGSTADLLPFMIRRQIELCETSIPIPARKMTFTPAPSPSALEEVATPLGLATRGEKSNAVFERNSEIGRLIRELAQPSGPILLVGEEGVGKSVVLASAARQAVRTSAMAPGQSLSHRIWTTNAGRLIAGMEYLGQWQERCENAIDELSSIGGWLCVDSLLDLILTGGSDARDSLAAYFLFFLRTGKLQLICETTLEQLSAAERLLPDFVEAFTRFPIEPLDPSRCRSAVAQIAQLVAAQHKVAFDKDLDQTALRMMRRFEPYRPPLGPATQLLRAIANKAQKSAKDRVAVDDAVEAYADRTGLPLEILLDQIPLDFDQVVGRFQAEVVGQSVACYKAASVVTTLKAGLNSPSRPLGVLLFCGPTGVGKTQLAKTLGNFLFGHSRTDALVRLDMSEYSGPSASDRLLCKPDRTPSKWLQRVRQQPFCVLLLDEIEKADLQVFDVLMGLMDEGRLTDAYGRTTNFTNAIVIMTSNLGVAAAQSIGFSDSAADRYEASVREFFRPEFFNRIDSVTPFERLTKSACREIIGMELKALQLRDGLLRRRIRLAFSSSVTDLLVESGFDENLGARPLQRSLEQHVSAPLARYLANRHRLADIDLEISCDATHGIQIQPRESPSYPS